MVMTPMDSGPMVAYSVGPDGSSVSIDDKGLQLAGAARTGFKASKVTFGGGTTRIDRIATGPIDEPFFEDARTVESAKVIMDRDTGRIAGSYHQKNLDVRISAEAQKCEEPAVRGYRLVLSRCPGVFVL